MTAVQTPPVPQGLVNIAVTPFRPDGAVDAPALRAHLDRILGAGYDGVLVGGTYGEFATLSVDERLALFEVAAGHVAGRVPLLLCAAAADVPAARRLARAAHELGGYPMLTPPFVSEVTDEQIEAYFRELAAECSDRIFIYNAPGVGVTLPVPLIERLATIPGVVGLKQGDLAPTVVDRLVGRLQGKLTLVAASDLAIAGPAGTGFDGLSSTNSCALPELVAAIYRAFSSGDARRGRSLNALWFDYRELARAFGQPQTVKAAMRLRGWQGGRVRAPLRDLDESQLMALRAVVERIVRAIEQLPAPLRAA